MTSYFREKKAGPYRSRRGVILGIFKGLSNYWDFPVFWLRFLAVLLLFCTGFWPVVGLYLLAGIIMKPEPALAVRSDEDLEFYSSYAASRTLALSRVKRTYEQLERRLRRLEDVITSKEYNWDRRFTQNNQ